MTRINYINNRLILIQESNGGILKVYSRQITQSLIFSPRL